jgi:hypothetical protein
MFAESVDVVIGVDTHRDSHALALLDGHRLDRGGDRQLNRALHTIVLARRRSDQRTIAYIHRRISEGKTEREAIRSLKRYIARSLYRLLEHTHRTA